MTKTQRPFRPPAWRNALPRAELTALALLLLTMLLNGCAVVNPYAEVAPSAKDRSGRFDGRWRGSVELTQEYQSYGHWEWYCKKYRSRVALNIADGVVSGTFGGGQDAVRFSTPVDAGGRFSIRLPWRDDIVFLIRGNLSADGNKGAGDLVSARERIPYGCRADWTVRR